MLLGDDRFGHSQLFFELLLGRLVRIDLHPFEVVAGQRFRVAAEQNIGTAAGHVGRDRHGTLASGLSDDLGFLLVVLCVQHLVRYADGLQLA